MKSSCWNYIKNFFHNVPKNDNEAKGNFIKNLDEKNLSEKLFRPQNEEEDVGKENNVNCYICRSLKK